MNSPVADKICTGEFLRYRNFVEFSDKVKSSGQDSFLQRARQNRFQRSGLVDSLGGEKKIGSLEKRHGIVEKSLVEYVSCGKLSVRKDDEGCIRIIFLIYMELW